jgi:GMP synthase (glutamine-hydrolysing)
MSGINILVVDGNELEWRKTFARQGDCVPSGIFGRLLKNLRPDLNVEIYCPCDSEDAPLLPLGDYDGIMITGSTLNVYDRRPAVLRQLEFAQSAFQSGTPIFGVCWGLQLAVVAAGGEVAASTIKTCKCEVPLARGISLTEAGLLHPMHAQRPPVFDALAFHSDHIISLPPGATVTARNDHFIQALQIELGQSVFWGVQYHPEATPQDMAGFMVSCAEALVEISRFADLEAVEVAARDFFSAKARPSHHQVNQSNCGPVAPEFAPLEIVNWLEQQVCPRATARREGA